MTPEQLEALIKPNIDDMGLIIHNKEKWGGGDTAQREGMWAYGFDLAHPGNLMNKIKFAQNLIKLQAHPNVRGVYVRHPYVEGCPDWYNDPKDFSRDQSIPLLVAMGRLKLRGHLMAFREETKGRFYRAQNGDPWWWPYLYAMWIRAFADAYGEDWFDYLNPMLWLGDITLVIASAWACLWAKWNPGHSDDLNFSLTLIQSHTLDTPLAKLARWVFARFRPPMQGTYETWGPASALEHYFHTAPAAKLNGAPRIDLLYNRTGILKNLVK